MITAMLELIVFWIVVLVLGTVLSALRDVYDDGPVSRPTRGERH